jgi:hypothetical protein
VLVALVVGIAVWFALRPRENEDAGKTRVDPNG